MNKLKVLPLGLTVLALSAGLNTAMADSYPKELEKDLISICRHAAENDRVDLHRAVLQIVPGKNIAGPAYRMVGKGLMCNDMTVANFASYYGAADTLRILERFGDPLKPRVEIKDLETARIVPETINAVLVAAK
ncbi:DUF3718 domain-containing protein [Salinimonas marina]|uniref:DUF3718 domain-containing protein n=1 Tax=Salinimonas marina TaxID=2785918 RepID=A0A7S9DWA9_9ALTE|nr:DUF3718 domain-containing protein [Salinimonas marina]QPG05078.1 DUF3718 domain-containing protein [Salinimonas marina]